MEAIDPATGHAFLEHALTGETVWKDDLGSASGSKGKGEAGSAHAASNPKARTEGATTVEKTSANITFIHR